MKNTQDLTEFKKHYEETKLSLSKREFYRELEKSILDWAKDYIDHHDEIYFYKYFFQIVRNAMVNHRLSRFEGYALIGLIVNFLYDNKLMSDDIDNFIDNEFYSGINGDGSTVLTFSDDPIDEDPIYYARSFAWKST